MMTSILIEIRQAMRRLKASPGYTLAAVATLSLGLTLSVAIYTVLNGVVLKGLPYPGGERVVGIHADNARQQESGGWLTAAEAFALSDAEAFEAAGWYRWWGEAILDGERPREITSANVSAGFFPALGVPAQLGRWLDAVDSAADSRAVVLSDREWQRLTNRDPGIVGQEVKLASGTAIVIGVMPPGFAYPSADVGLWRAADEEQYARDPAAFATSRNLGAVGRLRQGMDAERAARSLDALSAQLRDTHGLPDGGWRLRTTSLLEAAIGDVRGVLTGVFVVSLVVLAIACANVGSLLAARLAARERELAIVQALGASAARVWRGILWEVLWITLVALAAALLLLTLGLEAFRKLAVDTLPRADEIAFDPLVAAFAAGVAVSSTLVIAIPFGLGLRRRMASDLRAGKGTGSGKGGALRALPMMGLALATSALIAGAAVAFSLERLRSVDPGVRTADVYGLQVFHGSTADEQRRFARSMLTRLAAEPDAAGVAMTTWPPLAQVGESVVDVHVPGRDRTEPVRAGLQRVSPTYLEVMGQALIQGRGFLETDDASAPNVAIVNETLARRVFDGADVVGRYLDLPFADGPPVPHRIVGVVEDRRNAGLRNAPVAEVLLSFMQSPWVGMTFLVHAPRAGDGFLERMQEALWAVDPRKPVTRVSPVEDDLAAELAQIIFFTRTLGTFALMALLLAAFGTYSVIAFLQRRQVKEVGIRLALGAEPARVARRVLVQSAALAAVAGLAGSLVAVAVLRLIASQLFGISPANPALYALGIGGAVITALAGSAAPAWRAARVNPIEALRYE